jgi:tRNA pseudouridine38-40 synthase
MTRFLITLSFRGTAYAGWQIQPNASTVQETLEGALSKISNRSIQVVGCGRTDAGVHARVFYAHADAEGWPYPLTDLIYKLNQILPEDISISEIREISSEASARYSATRRTYRYYITFKKDPFRRDLAWWLKGERPDIEQMNQAASLLLGERDFGCFTKAGSDIKETHSIVYGATWHAIDDDIYFEVSAIRFTRNMVRAMVGTLLDVGKRKTSWEAYKTILESGNRAMGGDSVPAHGLYLWEVQYPESIFA